MPRQEVPVQIEVATPYGRGWPGAVHLSLEHRRIAGLQRLLGHSLYLVEVLTLRALELMNLATSKKIGTSSQMLRTKKYRSRFDLSAPPPTCGEDSSLINNDLDLKISEPRRSTLTPALLVLYLWGQPEKGYGAVGQCCSEPIPIAYVFNASYAAHLS
jgi:hypothetical protein